MGASPRAEPPPALQHSCVYTRPSSPISRTGPEELLHSQSVSLAEAPAPNQSQPGHSWESSGAGSCSAALGAEGELSSAQERPRCQQHSLHQLIFICSLHSTAHPAQPCSLSRAGSGWTQTTRAVLRHLQGLREEQVLL